jgi:flagellar motor switch protein FliN/FliY
MADEQQPLDQSEIEQLLQRQSSGKAPSGGGSTPAQSGTPPEGALSQSEIEAILGGGTSGASDRPASGATASETPLEQEDIDALLAPGAPSSPQPSRAASAQAAAARPKTSEQAPGAAGAIGRADVEFLLDQAERALESIDAEPASSTRPGLAPFQFEELRGESASTESATLDLISDVELDVRIELGRTHMYLEDVLKLRKGAVVPLDKLAGDPVDIYVNERLVARGEVLVLNDNFCVRVGELLAGSNVSG